MRIRAKKKLKNKVSGRTERASNSYFFNFFFLFQANRTGSREL